MNNRGRKQRGIDNAPQTIRVRDPLDKTAPALTWGGALQGTDAQGAVDGGETAPPLTITLDTDAAGHGWFIDTTPSDNSEYLPTSDPTLWKAKAGSAADGKMDLLSVLLHEYGHALGLEHNSNHADFMATSLVAGEHRMPSAEELTLMSQLLAQLKDGSGNNTPGSPSSPTTPFDPSLPLGSLGLLAMGRLRRNDYGNWTLAIENTQTLAVIPAKAGIQVNPAVKWIPAFAGMTDFLSATNATLTNPGLNGTDGQIQNWRAEGNIALNGNGGAVLKP